MTRLNVSNTRFSQAADEEIQRRQNEYSREVQSRLSRLQEARQQWKRDQLSSDTLLRLDRKVAVVKKGDKLYRNYLDNKYGQNLTAPLRGIRLKAAKEATEEVTDPSDRQWLIGRIAETGKARKFTKTQERAKAGYGKRFGIAAQEIGGAFADAGTEQLESFAGAGKVIMQEGKSKEDVSFLRDLEFANQSTNRNVSRIDTEGITGNVIRLAQEASITAAGMAPDMATGLLTLSTPAGIGASTAYWATRNLAERRDDFVELGMNEKDALLVGGASSLIEGAIENIIPDPSGMLKRTGVGRKLVGSKIKTLVKEAGTQTLRFVGELLEESLQAATDEGMKYLAGEVSDRVQRRDPNEIHRRAIQAARAAAPGLGVMSLAFGGGNIASSLSQARMRTINNEIMTASSKGIVPSRMQWKRWTGSRKKTSGADRKQALGKLAEGIVILDRIGTLSSGMIPTAEQWKNWGMSPEEGKTEQDRLLYLNREYVVNAEQRPPEAVKAPEGVPSQVEVSKAPQEAPAAAEVTQAVPVADALTAEATQTPPISTIEVSEPPTQKARSDAPARHDFPVKMKGTGREVSANIASDEIGAIWDVPAREGKIKSGSVRGLFKGRERLIRMQKGEEASPAILMHEVAHALDGDFGLRDGITKEMRSELAGLDYNQKARRSSEGIAEFIRAYVSGGASVTGGKEINLSKVAPKFLEKFEEFLSKNPNVNKNMQKTRAIFKDLSEAGAEGRLLGQVSKTGVKIEPKTGVIKKLKDIARAISRFKYEGVPVEEFALEAEGKRRKTSDMKDWELAREWVNIEGNEDAGSLPDNATMQKEIDSARKTRTTVSEDFSALLRTGPNFAAEAFKNGVFSLLTMKKIGPSMEEVLKEIEVGQDKKRFTGWMYARHAVESWKHKKNPGVKLADAESAMESLYDLRYERAADLLGKFNDALITMNREVGVIDEEEEKRITSFYKHHIPLERVQEKTKFFGSRKIVNIGKDIHGRRGSGLQIIDPLESSMSRAVKAYERGAKQVIVNKLYKTYTEIGGLGEWITEVPPDVRKVSFKAEQIKGQLSDILKDTELSDDAIEVLLDSMDPETMMHIWKPEMMQIKGKDVARVIIRGETKLLELHPDLMDALGGIEANETLGFITRVFKSATSAVKIGATRANVDFFVTNGTKDYQTFLMQGSKGIKGGLDPAKWMAAYAMSEIAKQSGRPINQVVALFNKMGGNLSAYSGLDRDHLKRGVQRAITGKQGKFETFLNIAGAPEIAARLAEFATVLEIEGWLEKAKNGQTPPRNVLIKAINAAHKVTVDFRRSSPAMRKLNYYLPFVNARAEGTATTYRTFKNHPKRTLLRLISTRIPIAVLYWWLKHDDDDYIERPDWQDKYYTFGLPDGEVLRAPRTHGWGLIDSGMERMLGAMYDKEPEQMEKWAKSVIAEFNPAGLPSGITPFAEAFFNYSFFKDRKIVSDNLLNLEKPDQYYEHTSGVAKEVGRLLHVVTNGAVSLSPAKLDHVADGISGGLFSDITSFTKKTTQSTVGVDTGGWNISDIPGLKGLSLRREFHKSVDDFYSVRNHLDTEYNSARKKGKVTEKMEDEHRFTQNIGSLMGEIRSTARGLSKGIRVEAEAAITGLARTALERKSLDSYKNPVNNLDKLSPAIRKVVAEHVGKKAVSATSGEKFGDTQKDAVEYLKRLGVTQASAEDFAFKRLRSGMRSSKSSRKQANRIRNRL